MTLYRATCPQCGDPASIYIRTNGVLVCVFCHLGSARSAPSTTHPSPNDRVEGGRDVLRTRLPVKLAAGPASPLPPTSAPGRLPLRRVP